MYVKVIANGESFSFSTTFLMIVVQVFTEEDKKKNDTFLRR